MNVGQLIEELGTYDKTLPVVFSYKKEYNKPIHLSNIKFEKNVLINPRINRFGNAVTLITY